MTIRSRSLAFLVTLLAACSLIAQMSAAAPQGKGKKKLRLTLTVEPSNVSEGGMAMGTVSHNNSDTSASVDVALASSDETEATVPTTVTIPVGGNSVSFPLEALRDNAVDGDQMVTISGAADGYQPGSATLTVTDPLPEVRYTIHEIPLPADGGVWINGMTNNSFVYGWFTETVDGVSIYRSGWVYDQGLGKFYELQLQASLLSQVETLFGPGWSIKSVVGMNDAGCMTGYVENSLGVRKGYVIDTWLDGSFSPNSNDWTVGALPDFGSDYTFGRRINELGDILAYYQRQDGTQDAYVYNPWLDTPDNPAPALQLEINLRNGFIALNNLGQVAGVDENNDAFIYDPSTSQWAWFSDADYQQINGLNDLGVFCGVARPVETYNRGKKTYERFGDSVCFRYTSTLESLNGSTSPYDALNSDSDVAFSIQGTYDPAISHTGFAPDYSEQTLKLRDLILDGDPLKTDFLDHQPDIFTINDRFDATGYSQVVCRLYFPQPDGTTIGKAVILTPVVPSAP